MERIIIVDHDIAEEKGLKHHKKGNAMNDLLA